jgi:hypothetical protein
MTSSCLPHFRLYRSFAAFTFDQAAEYLSDLLSHHQTVTLRSKLDRLNPDRMPVPPTLPNRQGEQERQRDAANVAVPSIPQLGTTNGTPPKLPPRQKAGLLNAIPDVQPSKDEEPESNATGTSGSASQPSAPRFVAPPPTSTSGQATLGNALHTVLNLFPSQRQDTPEEALIRRQLEEDQIARYMNSFSKHVQYLRIEPVSTRKAEAEHVVGDEAGRRKPSVEEFRAATASGGGGEDRVSSPRLTGTSGEKSADVPVESEGPAIDWFGYYAAVSINSIPRELSLNPFVQLASYYLHIYLPSLPTRNIQPLHIAQNKAEREPFTISRLRSSVERLYVNARSPWERLFTNIGEVVMWHDLGKSIKWLSVSFRQSPENTP